MSFIRIYILFFILLVSGCGFSPVYGTASQKIVSSNTSVKSNLNDVQISIIPDREGQYLRNALIDSFYFSGTPQNPTYFLRVNKVNESIYDFDITQDSEATRRQIKLTTSIILRNKATKEILLKRDLTAYASFNVLESEFSTRITEQAARENTLNDLARQIERDITLYLNR